MNWISEFTEDAAKDLRALPRSIQRRVARTVDQMAADPFQGDVKALKGPEWKGVFRRRIGSYRVLFAVNSERDEGVHYPSNLDPLRGYLPINSRPVASLSLIVP